MYFRKKCAGDIMQCSYKINDVRKLPNQQIPNIKRYMQKDATWDTCKQKTIIMATGSKVWRTTHIQK